MDKEAFDKKVWETEMGLISTCTKVSRSFIVPEELYFTLEPTLNKAKKVCDYTNGLMDIMTIKDEDYFNKLIKSEEVLRTYIFRIDSISAAYYSKYP